MDMRGRVLRLISVQSRELDIEDFIATTAPEIVR